MLLGMLLLGLLPLAVLPGVTEMLSADDEGDDNDADDLADEAPTGDLVADAQNDGTAEVTADGQTHVFADHQVGADRIALNIGADASGDFWVQEGEGGASLTHDGAAGGTVLSFPSLAEVPIGDIDLVMSGEEGEATVPLSDLWPDDDAESEPEAEPAPLAPLVLTAEMATLGEMIDVESALAPVDPDAPDVPDESPPADPDAVLTAVDPDAPDAPSGEEANDALSPVLDPVPDPAPITGYAEVLEGGAGADHLSATPDNTAMDGQGGDDVLNGSDGDDLLLGGTGADTLSGGSGSDVLDHYGNDAARVADQHHEWAWHTDGAADVLDGGAGNDTLIMDGFDTATGGAGDDVFWLYSDGDMPAAEVTDFQRGADFLRISLNPQAGYGDDPDVQVTTSADGADSLVAVDGSVLAVLKGVTGIDEGDYSVEIRPDIFP